MAFHSKKAREPIPEVDTEVWACTSDSCPGWMRDAYSFEDEPTCPICDSDMKKETRILPELE